MNCFKRKPTIIPKHELKCRHMIAHLQNKEIIKHTEPGSLCRLKFVDEKYGYITSYDARILDENETENVLNTNGEK